MGDFTVNVRQKPMDFNRWQLGLDSSLSVACLTKPPDTVGELSRTVENPSVFCYKLMRLQVGCGLLTGCRLRHITSLSWYPASVDTEHEAKLPKNPASLGLSEQNDMRINGEVPRNWSQPEKECSQWTWRNSNNA